MGSCGNMGNGKSQIIFSTNGNEVTIKENEKYDFTIYGNTIYKLKNSKILKFIHRGKEVIIVLQEKYGKIIDVNKNKVLIT